MQGLSDLSYGVLDKDFREGTHRIVDPEVTLTHITGALPVMGITRVANVTGLDRIGIPVVMVARPNSRSLSVAQGKGVTLSAAKASGVMEAIESYHGEHITRPLKIASYEELRYTHNVVDPEQLCRVGTSTYHPHLIFTWIEATDLFSNEPVWVPYEVVHTNYSRPFPAGSGCFAMSSNGCASGNHILEAINHGLCEVVERDSTTLWQALSEERKADTRIDLGTITDPSCLHILERFQNASVGVVVWETTTEIGIPGFLCSIFDLDQSVFETQYTTSGMGCHPSRIIALLRALTEAAQSRLTLIAGSRDDLSRSRYERFSNADELRRNLDFLQHQSPMRPFDKVVSFESNSIRDDASWILERLEKAGFGQALFVDLTRAEFGIPVVRLIVPGLEGAHTTEGYVPGSRARLRMQESE